MWLNTGSIVLKNNYCVQGASVFSALHNRVKVVLSTTTLKAAGTGDMRPGWAQKKEKMTQGKVRAVAWVSNLAHWGIQMLAVSPKPSFSGGLLRVQ